MQDIAKHAGQRENRSNLGPIATTVHCLGMVPLRASRPDTHAKAGYPQLCAREFQLESELAKRMRKAGNVGGYWLVREMYAK